MNIRSAIKCAKIYSKPSHQRGYLGDIFSDLQQYFAPSFFVLLKIQACSNGVGNTATTISIQRLNRLSSIAKSFIF